MQRTAGKIYQFQRMQINGGFKSSLVMNKNVFFSSAHKVKWASAAISVKDALHSCHFTNTHLTAWMELNFFASSAPPPLRLRPARSDCAAQQIRF